MTKETMTIYQAYPKSFKDTTGDGMGDIQGVIQSLDYLERLGIDMIWLNPFYPSPQYDNGYDISDYTAVDPRYGTLEDVDQLIQEADKRGIGIMLDMVLNHCSTYHDWFQKALAGDKYYQDFFYLKPAKPDGSLPTNWESKFGGPAWEPFGETDLYYLRLYDLHQADLNWHNPHVRQALYEVVRFWLDRGVKGLRFDVLNVIGKVDFVDSQEPGSAQEKALYTDTPIVHEWVQELKRETFGQYEGIVTVGEMSSTSVAEGIKYTAPQREELDMIFSFHHLKVDYQEGDKWTQMPFDFLELKRILDEWQVGMSREGGWNALFWNNHDQPRANSRFGDVVNYPYETATMLATAIHLMRGTPYVYQGEEIGMTNPDYSTIEAFQDIETLNNYQILLDKGVSESEALAIIQAKSRDNSRSPMQWSAGAHAGFTTGQPWLAVADNYSTINVEQALAEEDGIFAYYQNLIQLRKDYPVISQGSYRSLFLDHPSIMGYIREDENQQLLLLANFYGDPVQVDLSDFQVDLAWRKLIGNGPVEDLTDRLELEPYEVVAFIREK
ncbi:alpha,alpha-phosphotrehalase [Hutsoniella sourekii]|uniref:alpha,alpha-phosphotrehalase n=1 Tax=Hutsoniella sourekii TaxID=87650 RepID=UPI000488B9B2|nr:alpha,alpha-phosphotrehalase [Hutsoniella sourekii]